MVNLTLLFLWLAFCSNYLLKESIIRRLSNTNKYEIIFGSIIGLGLPVILPLNFLLFFQGQRNFGSKMNFLVSLLFTYCLLISSLIYLYYLINKRKKDLREMENDKFKKDSKSKYRFITKLIK